jgi:hypothetical protein
VYDYEDDVIMGRRELGGIEVYYADWISLFLA